MTHTNEAATAGRLPGAGSKKDLSHGLRAPGLLARRPLIGALMVLLGMAAYGALAFSLQTNGPLIQSDKAQANALHDAALIAPPFARDVMVFGFYLGEHAIVAIGAALVVYFIIKHYWAELSMVIVAWAGEGAIWTVLSEYYGRARPVFDTPVWHQMTAPGFPSGHAISAVMCFGLLAYLLAPKFHSRFWKSVVIVLAIGIIIFIGFSRLFVGDHYTTDVLAGYALGIAWSGFVYTLIELFAQGRRNRHAQEN